MITKFPEKQKNITNENHWISAISGIVMNGFIHHYPFYNLMWFVLSSPSSPFEDDYIELK